ncbi:MAG: hypothetical protein ABIH26_14170 [Candidatus Eisenbacteria bacterium]
MSHLRPATSTVRGNIKLAGHLGGSADSPTVGNHSAIGSGDLHTEYAKADGTRAFTGVVGGVTPTQDAHLATKGYVDTAIEGLDVKGSVACATTANITLSGEQTIDGILTSSSFVLVKNQTDPIQNGRYRSAAGAWSRADDMAAGKGAAGAFCWVEGGTANGDSGWACTSDLGSDVVGTDALTFAQFSGAGQVTAGAGLTKTGNTLDVGAGNGITVNADDVAVNGSAVAGDGLKEGASSHQVAIDASAIAGTGLEDDGSENLRIAAAAAGNGLTGGAGSALSVQAEDATISVGASGIKASVADATGAATAAGAGGSATSMARSDHLHSSVPAVDGENAGDATHRWDTFVRELHLGAGTEKTSAYTVTDGDTVLIGDAGTGAFVFTLPAATNGRVLYFKKIDSSANAIGLTPNGAEDIDGATGASAVSLTAQFESFTLVGAAGKGWLVF